jgi:hypothetical protein
LAGEYYKNKKITVPFDPKSAKKAGKNLKEVLQKKKNLS